MKPRPLTRPASLAVLIVIALSQGFAAARAQGAASWVKLARGPAFEVVNGPDGAGQPDEVTVTIPLTLVPGIAPEDVTVKLLDVRLGNRYADGLAEAFTVAERASAAQGRGPSLSIKVEFAKAPAQGTYNLLIEAATPSHHPPQLLELQLTRPAARLKSQPTLVIDRVLTPGFDPQVSGLSLTLSEDGGLTRVTDLKATAREFLGDRGQVISGTIMCPNPPPQIVPNDTAKMTYELHGDFPLGISRGTIELRSPQLAEAFTVAFEVRTRRASGLILLVIAAGLAVGYLLRTLLQQRVKMGETRLQGFDLRDRMRSEAARRPDETFRNRIAAAVAGLNAVLAAHKSDDLDTAIGDADTELRAALRQFEDRRHKAQDELDSFEKLVKTPWQLPTVMEDLFMDAARPETLREQLLEGNVKTVEDALRATHARLAGKVASALGEWRIAQKAALELLDNRYLPDAVSAAVSKDVSEAISLLDGASDLSNSNTFDEMSTTLGVIHKARARLSDLFRKLERWQRYEAGEILKALRGTALPDKAALDEMEKAATDFGNELTAAKGPEDVVTLLTPERLGELDAGWRDALEKQMDGARFSDEERWRVAPLLEARRYSDAARAAALILQRKHRVRLSGGAEDDSAVEAVATSAPPADSARVAKVAPASPPALPRVFRPEHIPEPVELGRSQTYRELLREKFLLFALTGLGITLVGYLLFEGKFVGTFADMAGIFLWAFGLDVTIDAFVRLSKGAAPRADR